MITFNLLIVKNSVRFLVRLFETKLLVLVVVLPAHLAAVADLLAPALDYEISNTATPCTLAMIYRFCDFELVKKIWTSNFNQNDLVVLKYILNSILRRSHWLQTFSWEVYTRVFFNHFHLCTSN